MPAKGSKYLQALSTPGPKTGRRYGAAVSLIRKALNRGPVTPDTLPIPRNQASYLLVHMKRTGEIKVIEKPILGPRGKPAVYAFK